MTWESDHDIMLIETVGSKVEYTLVLCVHVHLSTVVSTHREARLTWFYFFQSLSSVLIYQTSVSCWVAVPLTLSQPITSHFCIFRGTLI